MIRPGYNLYKFPFNSFHIDKLTGYFCLYPEDNNSQKRVVFTWLDFVKYKKRVIDKKSKEPVPAPKVKCVAWDLDNTLWDGILTETNNVKLRQEAVDLVKKLDERGILQTICSKNDFNSAINELNKWGLGNYFLYPAINWGQKSMNLVQIAEKLNIGLDTFAFIDDSVRERDEMGNLLPQVRIYSEQEIESVLSYQEFDVPITIEGGKRRLSYISEMQRNTFKEHYADNYEDFLIDCRMHMELFRPTTEEDITRCWEMVQRSNQLNLSGKRYAREDFSRMANDPATLSIAIKCHDKFGDYGIISYAKLDVFDDHLNLTDLAISCRAAQKRIEHTFIKELKKLLYKYGYEMLKVELVETERNKPLRAVFRELPFIEMTRDGNKISMCLDLQKEIVLRDTITTLVNIDQSFPLSRGTG
jgi:FkbH-like protein